MILNGWSCSLALACALALPSAPHAAQVVFEGVVDGQLGPEARFWLEGAIVDGDSDRVVEALRRADIFPEQAPQLRIVVALSSEGGEFHEGIDLAMTFRRLGLATIVRSGDGCFSACAIAFLGGSDRLKDPTPVGENDPLPSQQPSRSLEKSAQLGFHAPYLAVPDGDYNSVTVQDAYRAAVLGISRLVELADRLYMVPAELPRLLAPGRDEAYMADDVDAVRVLGINYTDYSYQIRENYGFTHSMILNACVNRYYHLQRRSSLDGFATALSVLNEFVEGSQLMENGEDFVAFGVRPVKQGTANTWLVYLPIAKTQDGERFVWCLFSQGVGSPTTFYKPGGTIEELFAELEEKNDLWSFSASETTIQLTTGGWIDDMMRAIDLAPPQTKLADVIQQLETYRASEKAVTGQ